MKRILLPVFGLAFLVLAADSGRGQTIDLRLSVKIIISPNGGVRPSGVTPQMFTNAVNAANQWMASYWRGYRYQLTEIVDIGGPSQGGTNGPSKWSGRDPRDTDDGTWQSFQADVQGSGLYLLRTNALNYYVTMATNWNTGGAAPFPWEAPGWMAAWGIVNDGPFWVVHECGHFYGLSHTHGGCGCPSTTGCTLLNGYWVGDDGLTDTLKEAAGDSCFTSINMITLANFNKQFTNCTLAEKKLAEDTYFNAMSYHDPPNKDTLMVRMTEQQADLFTTYANSDRANTSSGRTRFVSASGNNANSGLNRAAPKRTVLNAVNASAAGGGDIVLLRPGNYNELIILNAPVTLRAPRDGWATIGKP